MTLLTACRIGMVWNSEIGGAGQVQREAEWTRNNEKLDFT